MLIPSTRKFWITVRTSRKITSVRTMVSNSSSATAFQLVEGASGSGAGSSGRAEARCGSTGSHELEGGIIAGLVG